jgi:hypothetical protein
MIPLAILEFLKKIPWRALIIGAVVLAITGYILWLRHSVFTLEKRLTDANAQVLVAKSANDSNISTIKDLKDANTKFVEQLRLRDKAVADALAEAERNRQLLGVARADANRALAAETAQSPAVAGTDLARHFPDTVRRLRESASRIRQN